MEKQVKYKFSELPDAVQKHVRVFQIHQFFTWGGLGITMAIFVLLMQDRGFNLFDIAVATAVFSGTALLLELPLGGLADGLGRKPVFIMSIIAEILSLLVLLFFTSFNAALISYAFYGLGRALMSGTLDAWYIETFNKIAPRFGTLPILAKVQIAGASGLAVGAIIGGLLVDFYGTSFMKYGFGRYDIALVGNLVILCFVSVITIFAIKEDRHPLNKQAIKAGFANIPNMMRDAVHYASGHNIVSVLLVSIGLSSAALFALEMYWIPFAKPMIESQYAVSFIGLISAVYFFSMALGAGLSEPVVNIFKGHNAKAMMFFIILSGILFFALSFSPNIYVFVVLLLLLNITIGAEGAPGQSLFHDYVPDDKRSTLISLQSVVGQLGGLFGMLGLGFIAEQYSIGTAWQVGSVVVIISGLILLVLPERMANTPAASHDDDDDLANTKADNED